MKEKFSVIGMTCSACQARVEKAVTVLDGINEVNVNLLTNSMQVDFDEEKQNVENIIFAVEKAGYSAGLKATGNKNGNNGNNNGINNGNNRSKLSYSEEKKKEEEKLYKEFRIRLIVSFVFLIPLMYISMGHMVNLPLPNWLMGHENAVSYAFLQFLLCLPVIYINRGYYSRGFKNLFRLSPNMDSLIAVGSGASLIYGIFAIFRMSYGLGNGNMELVAKYHHDLYFESSVMILALITVGKFLEAKSKGKTSEALNKLMDLAPKSAIVEIDGNPKEVDIDEVKIGDIIIVKPGANITVDGVIIEGNTSVDEAAITGESIPVDKKEGDEVIAATANKTGFIKLRATRVGEDTTFSKIIKLVEEASSSKAPIAKIADKVSGIFVPIVMGISLATFVIWMLLGAEFEFSLSLAICVLVISCPCALGLATPVAIMVGTGKGAENGILIKSGEALEIAKSVTTVVFDKTGTITEGKPVVTDFLAVNIAENELKNIVFSLEERSEHALANAVIEYTKDSNRVKVDKFEAVSGKGVAGYINNEKYIIGNRKFFDENRVIISKEKVDLIEKFAETGKTPLLVGKNNSLIGIIAVADVVKKNSKLAISRLKEMGIKVIMLTGDNEATARGIGKELELDEIIAEVMPADKEEVISKLKNNGDVVAMVGDGINDAPALVSADVGIAISNGTDIAIESADIILMKNDLLDVVTAIKLSKKVIKNIKENLFWAFFYNVMLIPLAAGLYYKTFGIKLNPMFGAAAMSMSSIFVVTNALRIRLFKKEICDNNIQGKEKNSTDDFKNNDEDTFADKSCDNKAKVEMEGKNMVTLKVDGMMCMHCVKHVQDALNALDGVNAAADLETKLVSIENPNNVSIDDMINAVKEAGYEALLQ